LTYPSEKYELVSWDDEMKNMKVSWDDEIPNIWKNKIDVPNQQPNEISKLVELQMNYSIKSLGI